MRTRTMIGIAAAAGLAGTIYAHDLAAAYIAVAGSAMVYLLRAIDVKLNKLLRRRARLRRSSLQEPNGEIINPAPCPSPRGLANETSGFSYSSPP